MSELCILRVDGSMNRSDSSSRRVCDDLIDRLCAERQARVIVRDLADGLPFIDEQWIDANFTDPEERSAAQRQALVLSDTLMEELKRADILVMGVPIYNFGPPAAFKAWIDLIARARETFRYTNKGPRGLLDIHKGYLVVASGGTAVGGDMDYVTGYAKLLFGFLGVIDLEILACDEGIEENASLQDTLERLKHL